MKDEAIGIQKSTLLEEGWTLGSVGAQQLIQKLKTENIALEDYLGTKPYRGILTGLNKAFVIDENTRQRLIEEDPKSDEIIKPIVFGRNIHPYSVEFKARYLIWTYTSVPIDEYQGVYKYLGEFKTQLQKRWDKGNYWWELRACNYYEKFEKPKIMYPDIAKTCSFALDENGYFGTNTTYFIPTDDLFLLGLLNSKLGHFFFTETCAGLEDKRSTYLRFFTQYISKFPICQIDSRNHHSVSKQQNINDATNKMVSLHSQLYAARTPSDKTIVQRQIEATDKRIDKLVYELYGLTDDEIQIVENAD